MEKMKRKPLGIISLLAIVLSVFWLPFSLLGLVLYYLSKLMRSLGFMLLLRRQSMRNELSGFWRVYCAIEDYKVGFSGK